jgi:iron complex transport system ATP-binding protein
VIRARDVTVRARTATLVDGIDLEVAAGELVAIVGPNGAGKSTLLGALAGDRRLAAGWVTLSGRDAHALPPVELAALRAVLPQRSSLSLAFTATEVVRLAHRAVSLAKAREQLAAVEMTAFADRTYPSLSGGEQQRVQLARVLAQLSFHPSAALLLDEPTSALDPRHQRLVLSLARTAASRGHAVVAVLHDLTLAAAIADRVALLAGGTLLALGTPAEVLVAERLEAAYSARFEILAGSEGLVIAPRGLR